MCDCNATGKPAAGMTPNQALQPTRAAARGRVKVRNGLTPPNVVFGGYSRRTCGHEAS